MKIKLKLEKIVLRCVWNVSLESWTEEKLYANMYIEYDNFTTSLTYQECIEEAI